jgi:hypothetical protein
MFYGLLGGRRLRGGGLVVLVGVWGAGAVGPLRPPILCCAGCAPSGLSGAWGGGGRQGSCRAAAIAPANARPGGGSAACTTG